MVGVLSYLVPIVGFPFAIVAFPMERHKERMNADEQRTCAARRELMNASGCVDGAFH
ncbi:MAG: hypothetical protein ACLGHO_02515 [Gammaproteobacteria bacterium]